ncbi:hypothetical protein VNO77_42726 [Canavalia gladiata]|uniref:Translation initiation factor 3 N-terminal domain-containing protein n=1 Tax=Canavalia gladiata TaxID=3824 RepID=A0AAN9PMB0_CANGL
MSTLSMEAFGLRSNSIEPDGYGYGSCSNDELQTLDIAALRSTSVRLIDESHNMVGVVSKTLAREMAQDAELDLVIVSPDADPPVVKMMDYSLLLLKKSVHTSPLMTSEGSLPYKAWKRVILIAESSPWKESEAHPKSMEEMQGQWKDLYTLSNTIPELLQILKTSSRKFRREKLGIMSCIRRLKGPSLMIFGGQSGSGRINKGSKFLNQQKVVGITFGFGTCFSVSQSLQRALVDMMDGFDKFENIFWGHNQFVYLVVSSSYEAIMAGEFGNIAIELIKCFQSDIGELSWEALHSAFLFRNQSHLDDVQLATEETKSFRDRKIFIVMVPNKVVLQKAQQPSKKRDKSTADEVSAGGGCLLLIYSGLKVGEATLSQDVEAATYVPNDLKVA